MTQSNYILMKERADKYDDISERIRDILHAENSGKMMYIRCNGVAEVGVSAGETIGAIINVLEKRKAELDAKSKKIREKLAMIDELLGGDND